MSKFKIGDLVTLWAGLEEQCDGEVIGYAHSPQYRGFVRVRYDDGDGMGCGEGLVHPGFISTRSAHLGPLPPYEDPTALTRRDRFAMAALTALVSSVDDVQPDYTAALAYLIADALEAARNKEGGE